MDSWGVDMLHVQLTPPQVSHAHEVATLRHRNNIRDRRTARYGYRGDPFRAHLQGALGEKAVAVALGMRWTGSIGDLSAADVGVLQVRTTTHQNGRLILHPSDKDSDMFILAVLDGSAVDLAGWIMARDGKVDAYWCDPTGGGRHAFFVPRKALLTINPGDPRWQAHTSDMGDYGPDGSTSCGSGI